ncbi:MAG: ferrous iron transport protein B [Bacteroidia bacterium]
MKVALVGNPNVGKSTLFNLLTGMNQKVGNFPGVTVDVKMGQIINCHKTIQLIDLPGAYSIYAKSEDEQVTTNVITNTKHAHHPDVILYVADASSLKRSLFFCSQIMDYGVPVILLLNMEDVLLKNNVSININALRESLGIPVFLMSAKNNKGIEALKNQLTLQHQFTPTPFLTTEQLQTILPPPLVATAISYNELYNTQDTMALRPNWRNFQLNETILRYDILKQISAKVLSNNGLTTTKTKDHELSNKIDDVLLHKFLGPFLLLFVLLLVFETVFTLAEYPKEYIEQFFTYGTQLGHTYLPNNFFTDLLINGIWAGIAGVVIFVPQIALLFLLIALLEDSGYMARMSCITDRFMRNVGLNGRSTIPLISAFACAVPAIMGARTISNTKERLITMLVLPLMSCSARLPVFAILIAVAVPSVKIFGLFSLQSLVLLGLYLLGFLSAIVVALISKFILKSNENSYFIIELPNYRLPNFKSVARTIYDKCKVFLVDAGKVIVVISVVLWLMSNFGPNNVMENLTTTYNAQLAAHPAQADSITASYNAQKIAHSYAGIIGKAIEPAIKPLGFDWKIGIALLTSFAAREVFVGTMSTIYSITNTDDTATLTQQMQNAKWDTTNAPIYTLATAVSLLLFYLFAMQCMSTLAAMKRETGTWKWPIIQFVYMFAMAYAASFIAYQLLS